MYVVVYMFGCLCEREKNTVQRRFIDRKKTNDSVNEMKTTEMLEKQKWKESNARRFISRISNVDKDVTR